MKATPKYKQLASTLKTEIRKKKRYQPGMKLPTYQELAKDYGMSYVTVTNAVRVLAEQGLVKRIHGQGIYVDTPTHVPKIPPQRLIGILTPFKGDIFGNMCQTYVKTFEDKNILAVPLLEDITFHYSLAETEIRKKFLKIIDRGIDSLVIYGQRHFPFKVFQEFEDQFKSINYVIYHESQVKSPNHNYILTDNYIAGRLAADHLIKKGWHEILFVTYERMSPEAFEQCGPTQDSDISFMAGIKQAFIDNDLDPDQHLREVYDRTTFKDKSAMNMTSDFLDGKNRGIIAFGDFRMKWVYEVARKKDLTPGKDFGAIGWGNTSWCSVMSPTLSSISINEDQIASKTADIILNGKQGIKTLAEPKLIIRESTEPTA